MILLGLTGNIATGKSTVARILAGHGAQVIDADELSREAVRPGTPVYQRIVEVFGCGVVAPDGTLDRQALGEIVFADPARMRLLESLVHPAVAALRAERLRTCRAPAAVLEAVKLVEAGQHTQCDELWVVTSSPEVQFTRLVEQRGLPPAEARRRLAAQPPVEPKLQLADVVLSNDGSLEELRQQVDREWKRLLPG